MNDINGMNDTIRVTDEGLANDATTVFGFWAYLMTDFVLFAALFATYAVLKTGVSSPVAVDPTVLIETLVLLTSSFTAGLAMLAARAGRARLVISALGASALLGAVFLAIEISEFARLIASGYGPQQSGFMSSFFALVGTHGLHIFVGLLWVCALMIAIARRGLSRSNLRKLVLWSMFWHFLDLIWIFIFTIVYLFPL